MARRVAGGADNIGQELFRTRIAMQDVILRAFLIVEDNRTAIRAPPGQRACGGSSA